MGVSILASNVWEYNLVIVLVLFVSVAVKFAEEYTNFLEV